MSQHAALTTSFDWLFQVLPDSLMENVASSDGEIKLYTSKLHLHNVQDNMAGQYQCVVSNEFGSAFSQRAKINVYGRQRF